jgi:hypothetical protein
MTMPNFLIIGTAKAGTTSLHSYLNQHPEIYMSPNKEPRFFAFEGEDLDPENPTHKKTITNLQAYQALFEGVTGEKAIGETSPAYLVEHKAPARIKHYIPEAKIIAILRNPAERAYSHFLHLIKHNYESCHDFELALQNEDELRIGQWRPRNDYILFGFYYKNLKRYFDIFERNKIKIFLFEDLQSDPTGLLQKIFRFLEVDDTFTPDITFHHSVSGIPKNRALHRLIYGFNPFRAFLKPFIRPFISIDVQQRIEYWLKIKNLQKPQLSQELRIYLIDIYRKDILRLQELIGTDLSEWIDGKISEGSSLTLSDRE